MASDVSAADHATSRPPAFTPRQWGAITAAGLGLFLVFLDALVVNVALPDIQAAFDTGEAGLQWVVTAYSLGMAGVIMTAATLADRLGRRRTYLASVAVFVVGSAVAGAAPALGVLVAARAVQGVAAGAATVASLALLSATFPDTGTKARAIGIWTAIASVGTALGPSLGALLADVSWRLVFYVNVPVGIIALLLTLRFLDESRDPRPRSLDPLGQVLFIVSVSLFAFAVIDGQQDSFTSPEILASFAVAAVGSIWFVFHELRVAEPMMELGLFRNEPYTLAIVTVFTVLFAAYGTLLLVSQYLQNVREYSSLEAGAMLVPMAIAVMVGSPVAGHVVGRVGPRAPIVLGLASLTAGLLVIALGVSASVALIPIGMGAIGVGLGSTLTPTNSLAMTAVPEDRAGMASGIVSAQRAIGSTVGYAVFGTVLTISLSANLADDLEPVIPDASTRTSVADQIIAQADPTAMPAELGPARELVVSLPRERDEIVAIADDAFVSGIQLAFVLAAVFVLAVLVVDALRLPRRRTGPA